MRSGGLSVRITGLLRMLVWPADSWDTPGIVCDTYSACVRIPMVNSNLLPQDM